jgi:hypothetical protein
VLPPEAHGAPRTAVVAARALALGAAILVAAGCGDEDGDGSAAPSDTATELHLALDPDGPGGADPETAIVRCEPADGSACGRLSSIDFAVVDPQTPCTEIYGGRDEVEVRGYVGGEPVEATLTRANGCEISRFDELVPVLQEQFPGYEPGASIAP